MAQVMIAPYGIFKMPYGVISGGPMEASGLSASGGLALWVKIDEKIDYHPNLNSKTSFSLIFMQDLGNGWTETIGQGLHYSAISKKKAGIVLILETIKDRKYWIRLKTTIEHFNLPIDTWNVGNAAD
jgi:hypothetical protein